MRYLRLLRSAALLSALAAVPAARATEDVSTLPGTSPAPSLKAYAPDAPSLFTITVYEENDSVRIKPNNPTDRHYTNGTAISFAHQPAWADKIAPHVPLASHFDQPRTAAGYIAGQLIFTPDNINTRKIIRDDRPYAGYLFGGAYWQRADNTTFDHFQLDLGVVGPSSGADDTQKIVHDYFDGQEPNGWNGQLRDEFTAQLYARRKWRIPLTQQNSPIEGTGWQTQLIPQVGIALGSIYRHLEAHATLRAGFNLPDDFGPGRLADVAAATGTPRQGWGAFGFLRAGGRLVEHDLFLEGNTFKDSHHVSAKPLVGEIQAGVAVQYHRDNWGLELGYSQTYMTRQFDKQEHTSSFGALTLAFTGYF